jgi:glycosyltransferase involved in cell wall biosynthesis
MDNHAEIEKYSVVIPVYNSAPIVGETIAQTEAFFNEHGFGYEVVLVNDGSSDGSWEIIRERAAGDPNLLAVNLLRNYGQHTALFCGLQLSSGDFVITLDDDLQNPPEEIIHLISKIHEGHDVVFGQFIQKQHPWHRRLGSKLIGLVNERIFFKPHDLAVSNFRIMRRDVVDRICAYRTHYPYITGMALMFAVKPANVKVKHRERPVGKSHYNLIKIVELVMRILFNYSSYPLRMVSVMGMVVALFSLLLGVYFLARAVLIGYAVPGWATVVVLLAFLNGVLILGVSMLGEYTIRLLNQVSSDAVYHVKETVGYTP